MSKRREAEELAEAILREQARKKPFLQTNTPKTSQTPFGEVESKLLMFYHVRPLRKGEIVAQYVRQAFTGKREKFVWMGVVEKNIYDPIMLKYKILYRPFDKRNIYYTNIIVERPLLEVMRHMMHENLGLLFARPQSPKYEFSVFASETIIDQCVVGNKSAGAGISYIAPLYLYHEKGNSKSRTSGSIMMLLEPQVDYIVKKPNLSPVIVEQLTKDFKKTPSHEQIFFYIYAVLYSKIYRTKYAEFLKIDFPRVPFTKDYKLFSKMAEYGKRLVDLLLLKPTALDPLVTKFQGKGENKVEKVRYEQSKIFINKEKYFEGVAPQVWEYQIGGYQVCDKWLKDRKGRKLSLDDIKHYCKIVSSLQKTIEIQKAIDKIYSEIEKETI